jgi:hypothetical protein
LIGALASVRRGLSSAWAAWETFLFAAVDAAPLAALRIAFGLYLALYYVRDLWFFDLYLSPPALLPPAELPGTGAALVLRYVPYTALGRSLLFGLAILSALGLGAGLNTRSAAILTFVLNRTLSIAHVGRNSGDQVVSVLTFLFVVAALAGHAQRVWSLDARGRGAPAEIPAWSTRLVQLQLVLVYFFSGFHKLASPDWYRGEALFYVLQQTEWLRSHAAAIEHPVPIGLMTYGVLLFELMVFPVLVWPKATRGIVLLLGLLLHVGIALVMRVFVFGEIMPIFYLCFVEPRRIVTRLEAVAGRLLAGLRRRTRA